MTRSTSAPMSQDTSVSNLLPSASRRDGELLLPRVVASYLRDHYPNALGAFLAESEMDESTIPGDLPDLRTIVEEWQSSMLASKLAQTSISNQPSAQTSLDELLAVPLTEGARLTNIRQTFSAVSASNLLGVRFVPHVPKRAFDTSTASYRAWHVPRLLVTGVDRTLKTVDPATGEVDQLFQPHKAAILSFAQHPTRRRYILTASMDGFAVITDLITGKEMQRFQHGKFVVRCAFSHDARWMATASYDRTIVIYEEKVQDSEEHVLMDDGDDPELARDPNIHYQPRHTITLRTNPEAIVFHPSGSHLIYSIRSSHLLYYVSLTDGKFSTTTKSFNPHPLDDHVSFSVLNLAIHPGGRIIACQTGDHAGHGGERILLYDVDPVEDGGKSERLGCLWTGEAGDDYVLPRMAWLPDGSGIVVTTTTGHLTLLDLNGKVRSKLKVHGGTVNGIQASSDVIRDVTIVEDADAPAGWHVASVGYDGTIRLTS